MLLLANPECIKRWCLDDLSGTIDQFEDDLIKRLEERPIEYAHDYPNILLRMAGKVIVTTREIITLCSVGYPDGAMGLARNLYEQYMLLSLFQQNKRSDTEEFGKIVSDFYLDYERRYLLMSMYERKNVQQADTAEEAEQLNKLDKQKKHKGSHDYWWTGYPNFGEIEAAVRKYLTDDQDMVVMNNALHARYYFACNILHASAFGNAYRISNDAEFQGIDTCPKYDEVCVPLEFAALTLVGVVCTICAELGINPMFYKYELNKLAAFYGKGRTS